MIDAAISYNLGSFSFGETILVAGLENLQAGSFNETSYFVGAETGGDQFTVGVQFSSIKSLAEGETFELYGQYRPIEALEITASYLSTDAFGGTAELYGLNANYGFAQNLFVEGGVVSTDSSGISDETYTVSVGVDF